MSILCDSSLIKGLLDEFSTEKDILIVTKSFSNRYGDKVETTETVTGVKVYIQMASAMDDEVKEGVLKTGDIIAYFNSSDRRYAVRGYRIHSRGIWYEIEDVIEQWVGDTLYYIECRAKRYDHGAKTNTISSDAVIA